MESYRLRLKGYSKPNPKLSISAYSAAGDNPLFVDDFTLPGDHKKKTTLIINLGDSNSSESEEYPDIQESTVFGRFLVQLKHLMMPQSTTPPLDAISPSASSRTMSIPSSPTSDLQGHIYLVQNGVMTSISSGDLETDSWTAPSRSGGTITIGKNLQKVLWTHQKNADTELQVPLNAAEYGLKSAFKSGGSHFFEGRDDARPTDHRRWHEGFDTKVFAQSARFLEGKGQPILVKYRLSGNEQKYMEFYENLSVYGRNRDAFKQFIDFAPVNPLMYSAPASPELSRIAERFFAGLPLDDEFEAWNARALESGDENRSCYKIDYPVTPWVQFIMEVNNACHPQPHTREAQGIPFKNEAHKHFGMFIQDVILSNQMEEARRNRTTWHSVKVFQSNAQAKARQLLDDGKDFTPRDIAYIARLATEVDKDDFVEPTFNDPRAILSTPADINDDSGDETTELNENAFADAAAKQLLEEHAAEEMIALSKPVSTISKKKRKSGKSQSKVASTNYVSQENSSHDGEVPAWEKVDASPYQSKQESRDEKMSQNADAQKSEPMVDGQPSVHLKPVRTKANETRAVSNILLPSTHSVITLADFEDHPTGTESPIDDDKGWQTVVKSKQLKQKSNAARLVSGVSQQGTNSGNPRGLNPTSGHEQQNANREPGNASGLNCMKNQLNEFKLAKVYPTTLKNAASTSKSLTAATAPNIPLTQTSAGQPKRYENEFPVVPAKSSQPAAHNNILKIAVAVPREFTKSPVIVKGKGAKDTATSFRKDERKSLNDDPTYSIPSPETIATKEDTNVENLAGRKSPLQGQMIKQQKPTNAPIITSLALKQVTTGEDSKLGSLVGEKLVVAGVADHTLIVEQAEGSSSTTSKVKSIVSNHGLVHSVATEHHYCTESSSILVDDGPTTPRDAGSANMLDSSDNVKGHVNVEIELDTQSKRIDDSLSWVPGPLTGSADFEGRPRRLSLPQAMYRLNEEVLGEKSPSLVRRGRGFSLQSRVSGKEKESESETPPTVVLKDVRSPKAAQLSDDGKPAKKLLVVTLNTDMSFTIEKVDIGSDVHPKHPEILHPTSTDDTHGHPLQTQNLKAASGNLGANHQSHSSFIPGARAHQSQALPLPESLSQTFSNGNMGGRGASLAAASSDGPHETFPCTQCDIEIVPTLENKLVFCPGCGPNSAIKYCSIACLLVHAYDHATQCWNYPASARAYPHSFPEASPYIYETHPIYPENPTADTREKFRQRAFTLYARYGKFPNLAEAWLRKHPEWQWPEDSIYWDSIKFTGIYHIFASGAFEPTDRGNPKAHVIFVVGFANRHPHKQILSRVIHALLVRDEGTIKLLAAFAFRLILNFLITPETFKTNHTEEPLELVLPEFERQFKLEFGYDRSMDSLSGIPFNFDHEVGIIMPSLIMTETCFPILRYWTRDL